MQRDLQWEDYIRAEVIEAAERQHAIDARSFVELATTRMNGKGADGYGDHSFLNDDRDLLKEALEELADDFNYVLMEMERHSHAPHEDELAATLQEGFEILVDVCVLVERKRRFRARLREEIRFTPVAGLLAGD